MNKKGEGEGLALIFFLMLLALIPMCRHAGDNAYTSCIEDCKEINFDWKYENTTDWSFKRIYYSNNSEFTEEYVQEFCYEQCKPEKQIEEEKQEDIVIAGG